ncbi:MAG TPA: ABC transporter permease [Vicinamibacterales bacterium]|nr:ABC transporter permease [Vicinamibacterales bacterium]
MAASSPSRWILPYRWVRTRDLLRELIGRDIKLRYRGSVLGVLWTMLNPLAELLVLLFVFGIVLRVDIPNYSAFLFIGLIVYGWFQNSVNFATGAIVGNRELVRRPGVPTMILPIVTVASNMVHFVLSLPILLGLLLVSHVSFTAVLLLLPSLIVLEFVMILAFAYPVAIVHVWFRDTQHLLRIALQLLFYLTPVFYEVRTVPPSLSWIYKINPLAHLVDAYRAVLLRGELPHLHGIAYLTIGSLMMLAVSLAWFRHASHRFADEL